MGIVPRKRDWIDFKAVKENASAAAVLRSLGLLDGMTLQGDEYKGKCPFHPESGTNDCFTVNTEKKVFQCFACKKKGNLLDLVKAVGQCTIREAADVIATAMEHEAYLDAQRAEIAEIRREFPKKEYRPTLRDEQSEREEPQVDEALGIPFYLNPEVFLSFAEANRLVVTRQARSRDFVAVRVSTLTGGLLRERNRDDED
jgi:hypothetical protein